MNNVNMYIPKTAAAITGRYPHTPASLLPHSY